MFYSHEILTSRKYGVATVWLVATLGSKSTLKKVNRKAILDVDVPRACETIVAPEAPMALRLQGNLLYGVSRVFSQQCGYILADAQSAHNKMRALLQVVRSAQLDADAGKVQPDLLMLQDDPAFMPDFNLGAFDLDIENLMGTSRDDESLMSTTLSSLISRMSGSSGASAGAPLGGIIIPTSDTGGGADIGGFTLPGSNEAEARRPSAMLEEEDDGFLPEADFAFDEEGNLLELGATPQQGREQPFRERAPESDTAPSARERRERGPREGTRELGEPMDLDLPQPPPDDDFRLPEAEAFSPYVGAGREQQEPASDEYRPAPDDETKLSDAVVAVPQRRRGPKIMRLDQAIELHNADLAAWNESYVTRMADAHDTRVQLKAVAQAKRNAEFWVLEAGIGGVGRELVRGVPNPLGMFAGGGLWEMLQRINPDLLGRKRERDTTDEDETEEERRVRRRTSDEAGEIPRAEEMEMDDGMYFGGDDVELARHAATPLGDLSTATMPWNVAASLRGSSLSRPRSHSIIAGGAAPSIGPGHRLTSASPLVGRGSHRVSDLPSALMSAGAGLTSDFDDGEGLGGLGGPPPPPGSHDDAAATAQRARDEEAEFERFGAAAEVDTQTAAESQWARAAMDAEGRNFLDFIRNAVEEKRRRYLTGEAIAAGEEDPQPEVEEALWWVGFAELLPPHHNSRVVAAQGLMHTLALATKGLIEVVQGSGFSEIEMRVVAESGSAL